jgi:hypothetical protein
MRNAYKILVGKPEGKRSIGTHGHKWEDTINIDFKDAWREVEVVSWIYLAQDRDLCRTLLNTVMNLLVP